GFRQNCSAAWSRPGAPGANGSHPAAGACWTCPAMTRHCRQQAQTGRQDADRSASQGFEESIMNTPAADLTNHAFDLQHLLAHVAGMPPIRVAVVHPCDEPSLEGALDAR